MIEKKKKILVVDDDAAVRRLVVDVFRDSEYQVLEAKDGMEAVVMLNASTNKTMDVLLTDVIMPRMNGAELARLVLSRHPATRVIFMSGHPDEVVKCFGLPQENLRYINKPFIPKTLEQAVQENSQK